ncbi:MAG TPA: hypothetical protein VM327_06825 [Candidatus Thermoplasmatota archaeon]|nr:hypothetical protein [Candidatus Thermoplasmatota archaeon]
MVPSRILLSGLLVAVLASGCFGDAGANLGGIPAGAAAEGPNAGTSSAHADPERTDGAVTVDLESGQFVARQTVTITNDFGGASKAAVALSTGAGGVSTRAWSEGGYKVVVVLQARALTESMARDGLEDLRVVHSDRLGSGMLTLATSVQFPSGGSDGVSRSGTITSNLPEEPAYSIELDAGSGGATSAGLGGPSIQADTGSGGISLEGAFGRMTADAGSGGVELAGIANMVVASTGSGGISARLKAGASGTWGFGTGSGGVDLTIVRDGAAAYDVEATAGSGGVDVGLTDGDEVGSQSRNHQHVRSEGYSDAPIQVAVEITTGSGGVDVDDA